ncbi:MAG: signal peptide peptidase SppA [Gemmatimonadota bacterium]
MQRRSTVLGIVLLLVLFASGAVLTLRLLLGGRVPGLTPRRVAVLPIVGIIDSETKFVRDLEAFRGDPTVRAFVLEIQSPGGAVGASQAIHATLRRLREEDDRPLVAWIGDIGASGGYYVALPADSIFVLPGSITGSIGVIMQFPNAEELLRKVGLEFEVVKSGALKDIGSPTRELTDEERRVLQRLVDDVWEQFVQAVAEGRDLDRETVVSIADGRVFSGEAAVGLGLADGIGTLQDAVDAAGRMSGLGERPRVVRPVERRVGLRDLIGGVEESRLATWIRSVLPGAGATPRLRYEWQ